MALNENKHEFRFKLLGLFIKIIVVIVIISVIISVFYFAHYFGPRKVENLPFVQSHKVSAVELELLKKSQEYEREYEKLLPRHGRVVGEDALRMLESAIQVQIEYRVLVGHSNLQAMKRLNYLTKKLQNHRSSVLLDKSRRFEANGLDHKQNKRYEDARDSYVEAHALQEMINIEYKMSKAYSVSRITSLKRSIKELEAQPLYDSSHENEKKAKQAIELEDWDVVRGYLKNAIKLQEKVNDDFPKLRLADLVRLHRLKNELVSYDSIDIHIKVEKLISEAEIAMKSKLYYESAEFYQKAFREQEELIDQYPDSHFAKSDRLRELKLMRETALSRPLANIILADLKRVSELLLNQNIEKLKALLPKFYDRADKFQSNYPQSKLINSDILVQLKYLQYISNRIKEIQDEVYSKIVFLPDSDVWAMFNTEVQQSLYETVMNDNPSRNIGNRLPVDSVSLGDAKEFCERLSWITNRVVRLPNRSEYRLAMGNSDLNKQSLENLSWHEANSKGLTHDVASLYPNSNGFHDLFGNVEELLVSEKDVTQVGGGSVDDDLNSLLTMPFRDEDKNERSPVRGFRFVMKNVYMQ